MPLVRGTGISDEDQLNVFKSVLRHAESHEQLQREAVANGATDFSSSPTLAETVEEII